MASCEKCWNDAYYLQDCEEEHYETYKRLIKERKDNPCSEMEQAGQFWDEQRKVDTRKLTLTKQANKLINKNK